MPIQFPQRRFARLVHALHLFAPYVGPILAVGIGPSVGGCVISRKGIEVDAGQALAFFALHGDGCKYKIPMRSSTIGGTLTTKVEGR